MIEHVTTEDLTVLIDRLTPYIEKIKKEDSVFNLRCYPVTPGAVAAAYLMMAVFEDLIVVDEPDEADFFFDLVLRNGNTMERWCDNHPGIPFYTLIDKDDIGSSRIAKWYVFPWEQEPANKIKTAVKDIISFIGDDINRTGLIETPDRYINALSSWFSGYTQNPEDVLKTFTDGGVDYDEMIVVKDIPFYSKCEHHLADFFGTATIAYIPAGQIVGLSKLSRLLDIYARRLQVQERLTTQVADALAEHLKPVGVGVVIKARHMCMESRGISKQGCVTITSAVRGALMEKPEARAEFMDLAK